ncbi:MAG TPA: single-stranded DNA-binding protein [Clostridia bacterium]|nr:single-stranded DNA-binding protein [Clostridia bacterium]
MLNRVILIGRLTRDPELRYTTGGVAVANFTLAVDRPYTNQQGEREADFIRVITWRKLAEVCAQNLGKGRLVAVDGRLQVRSYDDPNGVRRQTAEVVAETVRFLDWPKDRGQAPSDLGGGGSFDDFGDPFSGSGIDLSGDDFPL